MKKILSILVCGALLVGCGMSKTGSGAIIGTSAGAAIGAGLGYLLGGDGSAIAIGAAVGGVVGAGTGVAIGKKMDEKAAELAELENAQVETVKDANGLEAVKVTFDSGILFSTGKSNLSSEAKQSLSQFATVLKNNSDCDIAIQGYTDNQGWKNSTVAQSQEKNRALSQDRAQAVSSYLIGLAVPATQIKSVQGFGEANPVADNSTAAGQRENRRVEVYMYASEAMIKAAQAQQ